MTAHLNKLDQMKELSVPSLPKNNSMPWVIFMFIMILPFLSLIFYLAAHKLISGRYAEIDTKIEKEMNQSLSKNAQEFERIFKRIEKISYRIRKSEQIQKAIYQENNRDILELQKENTFAQEALSIFVRQNNFKSAWLINRRLSNFVHSREAKPLSEESQGLAHHVFLTRETQYSTVFQEGRSVYIDVYMPITKSETRKGVESVRQIGVLVVRVSLNKELEKIFRPILKNKYKTDLYLWQKKNAKTDDLILQITHKHKFKSFTILTKKMMQNSKNTKKLWRFLERKISGKYNIAQRPYLRQKGGRYIKGDAIIVQTKAPKNFPFQMMSLTSLTDAYDTEYEYVKQVHLIAQLMSLIIFITTFSIWWFYQTLRQENVSRQYHTFAKRLNAQKNLFLNINTSIVEHVTLKDVKGRYLYANPSFLKFYNKNSKSILESLDEDIWDDKNFVKTLNELDETVLNTKKEVIKNLDIKDASGEKHVLRFQKTPFLDVSKDVIGIVTVVRDVTSEETKKDVHENSFKNTLKVFMSLLEKDDPYLVKHTAYLVHIVKELALYLKYTEEEKFAVEYAAQLSQVGKLFIEKDILISEEAERTPEMQKQFEEHITKSTLILDALDWAVPVVEGLSQMYERLDGSGYPNGLKGGSICKLARLLAVCDFFCLQTAPKRGEKVLTPEEVIKKLSQLKEVYDIQITQSLAELIAAEPEILMMR